MWSLENELTIATTDQCGVSLRSKISRRVFPQPPRLHNNHIRDLKVNLVSMQSSRFCLFICAGFCLGWGLRSVSELVCSKRKAQSQANKVVHPIPPEINGNIPTRGPNCVWSISHSNSFLLPTKNEIKAKSLSLLPVVCWPHFYTSVNALKDVLHVANCAKVLFQPHLLPSLHSHWFFTL